MLTMTKKRNCDSLTSRCSICHLFSSRKLITNVFRICEKRLNGFTRIRYVYYSAPLTCVSLLSTGRLCVWDVGPCRHWHNRGPANCRRSLQHQDDSPQEKEQLQTPEEEGQTARGQYPTCINHLFHVQLVTDDQSCSHNASTGPFVSYLQISNVIS